MADEKDLNGTQESETPQENQEKAVDEQNSANDSDGEAEMTAVPEDGSQDASKDASSESEDPNKVVNAEDASKDASSESEDPNKVVNAEDASEDASSESEDPNKVVNTEDAPEDEAEAAMMAMLEELPEDENKAEVSDINFPEQGVSSVEFQHLSQPAGKSEVKNIDMLMDVNLPISIELGRTKMTISDILALGPGSVVELNKLAGEPVDLLVNQRIVAKGEVVVIDENFGVRVTQLMTPEERLKALGEEN